MPGLFPFDVQVSEAMFNLKPLDFLPPLECPPFMKMAPYSWSSDMCREARGPAGEVLVNLARKGGIPASPMRGHAATSQHAGITHSLKSQVSRATWEADRNRGVASVDEPSTSYPTIRDP